MRSPRLVYVVTHPISANVLLAGQLAFMRRVGFEVTVISSDGPDLDAVRSREGVVALPVAMERAMAPGADARSLREIVKVFRGVRPDLVNASTPKAGLLGMLAARACRTPVRLYLLRGLRLQTTTGLTRRILATTERIASSCAHEVIAVSPSLREAYLAEGLASPDRVSVLGAGSSNGVDVERFAPTEAIRAGAARVRAELGIPAGAPLLGFIGRPSRDKGIGELLDAFDQIRRALPDARVLFVSADLADEDVPTEVRARLPRTPGVALVPRQADVRPFLAALDVLAFPSHREGFPNVVLEAAALGVPAVGYRATGVVDAIADGVTGAVVGLRDVHGFARAVLGYLGDPAMRRAHGEAARARVEREFARPVVWRRWATTYDQWLARRGLPRPAGL